MSGSVIRVDLARDVTPDMLMRGYASGIFPMANDRRDATLAWIRPPLRGIMPLDGFHMSRSLARRVLGTGYRIETDADFAGVVAACADRPTTWISRDIAALYGVLHQQGHAHSLEVRDGDALVGGVYGVALGGAFFGESMFSRRTDASKIALVYLLDHLRRQGFRLFDTQYLTPHLQSLGGLELPRAAFERLLTTAMQVTAPFGPPQDLTDPQGVVQRRTQTS